MSALSDLLSFLREKGLTVAQAAGVAGNFAVESKLNSAAYNPKEGAIGYAQWEGPRRVALQRFAASLGEKETDPDAQRQFLWHELNTSEASALAALKATTTARQAATVFDQKYERSSGSSRTLRVAIADKIAGTPWTSQFLDGLSSALPDTAVEVGGATADGAKAAGDAIDSALTSWAKPAFAIGLKILGAGAAAALVIVGAVHTVK
jgi:hypothetical protein